jgi:pSer/pThr/pTyr-binding forkhead associated (FHA) protein
MPWLTTEGASHQISEGETVVGSGPEATWRLGSRDLAARHFGLTRDGPRVTLRPCGVDSIIAINGKQSGSQGYVLRDGDTVDAGRTRFVFTTERAGTSPGVSISPAHLLDTRSGVAYGLATSSAGIGRDRMNSVIVRDPTASRFHAEIRREAGGYVLHPHGAAGTLVNGRRVGTPHRLDDGDRIEIANTELRFVASSVPPGAPTAEPVPDDESGHRPTVTEGSASEVPGDEAGRPKLLMWLGIVLFLGFLALAFAAYLTR